ncbi:MAG TPA: hypothetical protein DCP90_08535 [Clostridiales bacterium]|nr:MAG: hypothetical protein A2Y22_05890 [Clostridiales bacterium GWD2_32_59]HAN10640.1 hypothetical protein [Clostridiales bacterium]
MTISINTIQDMAVKGLIIAIAICIVGYIILIREMRKQKPKVKILKLMIKAFRSYLKIAIMLMCYIPILTIITMAVLLNANTDIGVKTIFLIMVIIIISVLMSKLIKITKRLIKIKTIKNTFFNKILSSINMLMVFSTMIGASFIAMSIFTSYTIWKDTQVPFKNFQTIKGVVKDVNEEKDRQNIKYMVIIEYEIDNKKYIISERTNFRNLYKNRMIDLVYNKENYAEAHIDKYDSPIAGYAAMFIFFYAGVFFVLIPIKTFTGKIKWKSISGNSFEMVNVNTKKDDLNVKSKRGFISKIISFDNPRASFPILMSMIFIMFSLLMTYAVYEDNKTSIKNQKVTTGIIINNKEEYQEGTSDTAGYYQYRPIIRFYIEGKEYIIINRNAFRQRKINEEVEVVYNKKYPYQAEMVNKIPIVEYGFCAIFFTAGIILFGIGAKAVK